MVYHILSCPVQLDVGPCYKLDKQTKQNGKQALMNIGRVIMIMKPWYPLKLCYTTTPSMLNLNVRWIFEKWG